VEGGLHLPQKGWKVKYKEGASSEEKRFPQGRHVQMSTYCRINEISHQKGENLNQ